MDSNDTIDPNLINIKNRDGVLVTNSRDIAERFNKQHKDVIIEIEKISIETLAENYANLFISGVKITELFITGTFQHKENDYKKS